MARKAKSNAGTTAITITFERALDNYELSDIVNAIDNVVADSFDGTIKREQGDSEFSVHEIPGV